MGIIGTNCDYVNDSITYLFNGLAITFTLEEAKELSLLLLQDLETFE